MILRQQKSLLPAVSHPPTLCTVSNSFSLHFNGHFPGEPGLAGVYWSTGWWRWWRQLDYWSYESCKAPVKSSPPTNQHPVLFTGRMPFLSSNQQCQSTEGKISHSMDLLIPSSPGGLPTLSLTINSSWLTWGRLPYLSSALRCQYPRVSNSLSNEKQSFLLFYYKRTQHIKQKKIIEHSFQKWNTAS